MAKHEPFGAKLKALRKKAKLTIDKVAADTGVSVRMLRAYEQGENSPKDYVKVALCNYYNVSVAEIFFA